MFMRIITEKCDVDLRRIFGILFRAGKFGAPPQSLMVSNDNGRTVSLAMPEVTYTSRLALALKAMQNRAATTTLQYASEFAANTGRVDVLDNFNLDATFRRFAINEGMSTQDLTPQKQMMAERDARAKQAQQMQQLQAAELATKSAANLGKAPQGVQDAANEAVGAAA